MGIKKVTKNFLIRGFNVKEWTDYRNLKMTAKTVAAMYLDFNSKPKKTSAKITSFDQAVKHFKLGEEDLAKRRKNHQRLAIFCLLLSILVLIYTIYLSATASYLSTIACSALYLLLLAYAYTESLKSLKIKKRRLDCTFQQWFTSTFKREN